MSEEFAESIDATELNEKLMDTFAGKVVRKDLKENQGRSKCSCICS